MTMRRSRWRSLALCAERCSAAPRAASAQDDDGVRALLRRLEPRCSPATRRRISALLGERGRPRPRRATSAHRNSCPAQRARVTAGARPRPARGTLPGNGYRLLVDVFVEFGSRARIATWRLDIKRPAAGR